MVRKSVRSLALVISAVFSVLAIGWSMTLSAAVQLLAVTVLAMGGTQHPLVDAQGGWADSPQFVTAYTNDAIRLYVAPSGTGDPADYNAVAVYTPEEFGPVFGTKTFDDSVTDGVGNLDKCVRSSDQCVARTVSGEPVAGDPIVIYGYSQSAVIATLEKRELIKEYGSAGGPDVSFVLIANPNRPNGGILERFEGLYIPLLDVTFNGATPTNSSFTTVDIARQYDGWADFPAYPLNMVATVNALLGIYYLHGDYSSGVGTPLEQGAAGDTTYYMIPTKRLPLLMPLEQLGVPSPILTALDAPLRVIVEWGYDRNPDHVGTPTKAGLIPVVNPITGLTNLVIAIPTGLDDGLAEAATDPNFRPLGTKPVKSPYGVGGEELGPPLGASEPETTALRTTSTEATDPSNGAPAEDAAVAEQEPAAKPEPVKPVVDRPRTNILRNVTPKHEDTRSDAPARPRPIKDLITRITSRQDHAQEPAEVSAAKEPPKPADESDSDAA